VNNPKIETGNWKTTPAMPLAHPQLHPRAFSGGRVSSSIDGISASLGTAEVIGIVGAIILAVVIVVLVCVMYRKKDKEDAADAEKNASIDAWSGSDMPAGELRRDEAYEEELRRERGRGTPGQGAGETVGLLPGQGWRTAEEMVEFLPGPARMQGAVVRR
jgi:hypothetical protein